MTQENEKGNFKTVDEIIALHTARALLLCAGNQVQSAKLLGVTIHTIRAWIEKYKIMHPKCNGRPTNTISEFSYRDITIDERDDWYNRDWF